MVVVYRHAHRIALAVLAVLLSHGAVTVRSSFTLLKPLDKMVRAYWQQLAEWYRVCCRKGIGHCCACVALWDFDEPCGVETCVASCGCRCPCLRMALSADQKATLMKQSTLTFALLCWLWYSQYQRRPWSYLWRVAQMLSTQRALGRSRSEHAGNLRRLRNFDHLITGTRLFPS